MSSIPNRISATMSEEELTKVRSLMDDMERSMPFLLALEQKERQTLPKFGDSRLGFVNQGYELVKLDPSFVPGSFSVEEMAKDVTLLSQLRSVLTRFERLSQKLKDTYFIVGSEAFKAGLVVYSSGKANAGPELAPMIQSMGDLFRTAKKETGSSDSSSEDSVS